MRVITNVDNWKMFVKFNRKEAAGLINHCFNMDYMTDDDFESVIDWCMDNTKDLIYFEHYGNLYDLSSLGFNLPTEANVNVYIKDNDDAMLFKLTWAGSEGVK